MRAISKLTQMGVTVCISENGTLKLQGKTNQMNKEQIQQAVEYARKNKTEILAALRQSGAPGECESCPAAGYWDYAQYSGWGLLCFHSAYYIGRAAKPKSCNETRRHCPRKEDIGG